MRWDSACLRQGLRNTLSAALAFGQGATVLYCLSKYGVFVSRVTGDSMFPTYMGDDEKVLVEAITPMLGRITPGDVVICVRPVDAREHIIKRVMGIAGDEVLLYPDRDNSTVRKITVPKGHVWIQGDNLLHSFDSRTYGPVPLALVRGRVICQVWPLKINFNSW